MKNTFIAVVIATTLGLGTACFLQWQRLAAQKAQVLSLRGELEQQTREMADLRASQKLAEHQRREVVDQAAVLAEKLQARIQGDANAARQSSAAAASTADPQKPDNDQGGFGTFLAKMMDDPDTKKLIREQQRMMLDQLYSPLLKKLQLTPDETSQFMDLLADNMMKGAEKATSLLGSGSSTNRAEMFTVLAAEQKDFDEQVRGFLGETRYAQYKDYQQTVGERTQLSQFQLQSAGGENALTDQRTEQMLGFMKDEKQAVAADTGLPLPGDNPGAASMQAMFSGEGVEKLLQSQETVNQRVYERAREVLSAEQLGAFGKFQTNQLQMMRMSMSMARKFMSPENPPAEAAPPNP